MATPGEIADDGAAVRLVNTLGGCEVMGMDGDDGEAGAHARPGDTCVDPEAAYRLPRHRTLVAGVGPRERRHAGEAAGWQRKAVEERDGRVVRRSHREMLPQTPMHSPQIGGLTSERGPVDQPQRRGPGAVVPPEVAIAIRGGVDSLVRTDDFNGQDLAVAQRGLRSALA